MHKIAKNLSKDVKSDNFCYHEVGRAITKWGAIKKRQIMWKKFISLKVNLKLFRFLGNQ